MTREAQARAQAAAQRALAATAEHVKRAKRISAAWERRLRRLKAHRPRGG